MTEPDGRRNCGTEDPHLIHAIDGVQYAALTDEDTVPCCAVVFVTVKTIDGGGVVEERKCELVAGVVDMRPGRHRGSDAGDVSATGTKLIPMHRLPARG